MKLSDDFYKQLNSIENFRELDYDDFRVVAIRQRADQELEMLEKRKIEKEKREPIKRVKKVYVYEMYKGKNLIARGTAKEIADKTGYKESSIRPMSSPSYHEKINKKVSKYTERVGKR